MKSTCPGRQCLVCRGGGTSAEVLAVRTARYIAIRRRSMHIDIPGDRWKVGKRPGTWAPAHLENDLERGTCGYLPPRASLSYAYFDALFWRRCLLLEAMLRCLLSSLRRAEADFFYPITSGLFWIHYLYLPCYASALYCHFSLAGQRTMQ